MADLFDNQEEAPLTPAQKQRAHKKFYDVVEKLVSQHPGSDNASKELENLAARLWVDNPEYIITLVQQKKITLSDVLYFAYRILQTQED
jgi:hypothetical protein